MAAYLAPPSVTEALNAIDDGTKPMPAHLKRELDNHRRRDPLFDPQLDRSQMSKELQKFFANILNLRPQS
jgi:hypothetical protein